MSAECADRGELFEWARVEAARRCREETPARRRLLAPAWAFGDDERCDAETGEPIGRDAAAVRAVFARSTAGWEDPPSAGEFHVAIRARCPDTRQRAVVDVFLDEASVSQFQQALIEGAFTLRQLARAIHARCKYPPKVVFMLNRKASVLRDGGRLSWNA